MDELKAKMVNLLVEQAATLAEMNATKQLEPEQIRKNALTILSIYQEVVDYYVQADK